MKVIHTCDCLAEMDNGPFNILERWIKGYLKQTKEDKLVDGCGVPIKK